MSFLTQDELYNLGKDGVKVPIPGYKFGKDGIIVPDDNNSYNLGKDGTIIPKPGYTIGKGGIIVKIQDSSSSSTSSNSTQFLTQDELYNLGKDGVKVPIPGYKFGKDGIIVPDDNNSYNLGKDGAIIPKPGYTIGKGGIIVKIQDSSSSSTSAYAASFFKSDKTITPPPSVNPNISYDFSKSNLVLMVGGQILILVFLLMIVFFGTAPLSFPANAVRKMINGNNSR